MRLILLLALVLFAIAGALFGALNPQSVTLDLYFLQRNVPLGSALLVALVCGWLLGGMVMWLVRVPRLRRELRATRREVGQLQSRLRAPVEAPLQLPAGEERDAA